jgi:hypothetical protein
MNYNRLMSSTTICTLELGDQILEKLFINFRGEKILLFYLEGIFLMTFFLKSFFEYNFTRMQNQMLT